LVWAFLCILIVINLRLSYGWFFLLIDKCMNLFELLLLVEILMFNGLLNFFRFIIFQSLFIISKIHSFKIITFFFILQLFVHESMIYPSSLALFAFSKLFYQYTFFSHLCFNMYISSETLSLSVKIFITYSILYSAQY
jgi:hypothetical protein